MNIIVVGNVLQLLHCLDLLALGIVQEQLLHQSLVLLLPLPSTDVLHRCGSHLLSQVNGRLAVLVLIDDLGCPSSHAHFLLFLLL